MKKSQSFHEMNTQVFMALSLLNDLKAAAFEAIGKKHKGPGLLLLYSFIDICASLANDNPKSKNSDRFKKYLLANALCKWIRYSPHDLWAARSSLLHAYSPFGDHTKKSRGAKPIFYYSWPEKPEEVEALLKSRGHEDFIVVNVEDIKGIAVTAYNSLFIKIKKDPALEATLTANATRLLRMTKDIRLEQFMEWVKDSRVET